MLRSSRSPRTAASRLRTWGLAAGLTVAAAAAVSTAALGSASAATTTVSTLADLKAALGTGCHDGDTIVLGAAVNDATAVLTSSCTTTLDLHGYVLTASNVVLAPAKALTVTAAAGTGPGSGGTLTVLAPADTAGIATTGATLDLTGSAVIRATGGANAAGIGGAAGASGGVVVVDGARVTASGGYSALGSGKPAGGATPAPTFGTATVTTGTLTVTGPVVVPDATGTEITVGAAGTLAGTATFNATANAVTPGQVANGGTITIDPAKVLGSSAGTGVVVTGHAYRVGFANAAGSAAPASVTVLAATFADAGQTFPTAPTRPGYDFDAWKAGATTVGATTALPGSAAVGSTPLPVAATATFADPGSSLAHLTSGLASCTGSAYADDGTATTPYAVTLAGSYDTGGQPLTVACDTTIDLHGTTLTAGNVVVSPGATLTVTDTTGTAPGSGGLLTTSAPAGTAGIATTDAALALTGTARVVAVGGTNAAGIGGSAGASAGTLVVDGASVTASGGYTAIGTGRPAGGAKPAPVVAAVNLTSGTLGLTGDVVVPDSLTGPEITVGAGATVGGTATFNPSGNGVTAGQVANAGTITIAPARVLGTTAGTGVQVTGHAYRVGFTNSAGSASPVSVTVLAASFQDAGQTFPAAPTRPGYDFDAWRAGTIVVTATSTLPGSATAGTTPLAVAAVAGYADPGSSATHLTSGLAGCTGTSYAADGTASTPYAVTLAADLDTSGQPLTVACDTTLDLHGHDLTASNVVLAAGTTLTVTDTTATGGTLRVDASGTAGVAGVRTTGAALVVGGTAHVVATAGTGAAAVGGSSAATAVDATAGATTVRGSATLTATGSYTAVGPGRATSGTPGFGTLDVESGTVTLAGPVVLPDTPATTDPEITVATGATLAGTATFNATASAVAPGRIANAGAVTIAGDRVLGTAAGTGAVVTGRAYRVGFTNATGSASPASVVVLADTFAHGGRTFPADPTRPGYDFTGWTAGGAALTATTDLTTLGTATAASTPVVVGAVATYADPGSTIAHLSSGLASCTGSGYVVTLAPTVAGTFTAPSQPLTVGCDATLDLHGRDLSVRTVALIAGTTLTVTDSTGTGGTLGADASGQGGLAGIGTTGASLVVSGTAHVVATGGPDAAGIGGGQGAAAGSLTVSGSARVEATAGLRAAGIGGGSGGAGGTTTVSGGDVTASGTSSALGGGDAGTGAAPGFGSVDVARGVLRATGAVVVPDSTTGGAEIVVETAGTLAGGATFSGAGQIANAGTITVPSSNLTGAGVTVTGRHYRFTFTSASGTTSATPSPVTVLARTFTDGARDFPATPVRPGYVFDGWYLDAAGTGTAVTATSDLTTNTAATGAPTAVTLYAVYLPPGGSIASLRAGLASCDAASATAPFTITLARDLPDPAAVLTVGCAAALDLHGHTLTVSNVVVTAGRSLAVGDSTQTAGGTGGTLVADASASPGVAGIATTGATLTVGDGTTLQASGGAGGAGIGGAKGARGGTLVVSGAATVTATGGRSAAGVGGGSAGDGGTTTVGGTSTLTATGGAQGAGIGAGDRLADPGGGTVGTATTTTTTTGSATVTATGGSYAPGIGGGTMVSDGGTTTASGTSTILATGGYTAAGIGGGYGGHGGALVVGTTSPGTVTAVGGTSAAGVGGGYGGAGGAVTVASSSTLTATGSSGAAGVGGGYDGAGGTTSVAGVLVAQGGYSAVGSGRPGSATRSFGTVAVTGRLTLAGPLVVPHTAGSTEMTVGPDGVVAAQTGADVTVSGDGTTAGTIANAGRITVPADRVRDVAVTGRDYSVDFDPADGNPVVSVVVLADTLDHGARSLPATPVRAGYTFTGWRTAPVTAGDPFTVSTTLPGASTDGRPVSVPVHATWSQVPVGLAPPVLTNQTSSTRGTTAPEVGDRLAAVTTTTTPSGAALTHRWSRTCGTGSAAGPVTMVVPGATAATYRLAADDVDCTLTATVTAALAPYADTTDSTPASGVVATGHLPVPTVSFTGTPQVATPTTVTLLTPAPTGADQPGLTVAFAWHTDGATTQAGAVYTPTAGQVGAPLVVDVTLAAPGYTTATTQLSTPDPVTNGVLPDPGVTTTGGAAQVGRRITAAGTPSTVTGYAVTWQWQTAVAGTSCAPVADPAQPVGTGVAFTPPAALVGTPLRVVATVSAPSYTTTSYCRDVGTVAVGDLVPATVKLDGPARVAVPLTASVPDRTLVGATATWRWQVVANGVGTDVPGATGPTYTPTAAQVGQVLRAVVVEGATGYRTLTEQLDTAAVATGTLPATVAVVDGGPQVAVASTVRVTSPDPAGVTGVVRGVQWQTVAATAGAPAVDVPGATTTTVVPSVAQAGSTLQVVVTTTAPGYAPDRRTITAGTVAPGVLPARTVTLSADPRVDVALTAAIGPDPGVAGRTLTWRWQVVADGVATDLPGATSAAYTPTPATAGLVLRVVATREAPGYEVGTTTLDTLPVAPGTLPALTVTTAGDTTSGATRTATAVLAAGPGADAAGPPGYRWLRSGVAVPGATDATYVLTDADVGSQVSVVVTRSSAGYADRSAASPGVLVTAAPDVGLAVTGTARVGGSLLATVAPPSGSTVSWQWQTVTVQGGTATGTDIAGATRATFVPTPDQLGRRLAVVATISRAGYAVRSLDSLATPTAAVRSGVLATFKVSVDGTPRVGRTLRAVLRDFGDPLPAGYRLRYRWNAGGRAVAGATAVAFRPRAAQVGKRITVTVTATATAYTTATSTSPGVGPVRG